MYRSKYSICMIIAVIDQVDLRVTNSLLFISSGDSRTCFEIEAIDDAIIEDTEVVNITVIPFNPNDRVMDGVVSVTIVNSDGMCGCSDNNS